MAKFNLDVIKRNLFSLLKYLIGWPLSFVALFFVIRLVFDNASKTLPNITNINYGFLFIGILSFLSYFFLRTYLWKYILGKKGEHIAFKKNALYWSTSELKRYVPGNIWSFLARTSSLEKEKLWLATLHPEDENLIAEILKIQRMYFQHKQGALIPTKIGFLNQRP